MKPNYIKTRVDMQLDVENGTVMAMARQSKERFRPNSQQVSHNKNSINDLTSIRKFSSIRGIGASHTKRRLYL